MSHILEVQHEISHAAGDFQARLQQVPSPNTVFPTTRIDKQLETAVRLLAAQAPIAVIKVTDGSFDTHAGQLHTCQRLLEELAQALVAFRAALLKQNLWDRVLIATYSEFGRRVAENGSTGADHGAAFLLGGTIKSGLYGPQPSLIRLQNVDLRHTVDDRSFYTTIIEKWWG